MSHFKDFMNKKDDEIEELEKKVEEGNKKIEKRKEVIDNIQKSPEISIEIPKEVEIGNPKITIRRLMAVAELFEIKPPNEVNKASLRRIIIKTLQNKN